ncbi:MAG: hypothetical protein N4A49_11035 [Marinifilaceae bacterium]|jgi:hypothetical protein|nr:hypothetical protein [Marinifilaceae bacterium]
MNHYIDTEKKQDTTNKNPLEENMKKDSLTDNNNHTINLNLEKNKTYAKNKILDLLKTNTPNDIIHLSNKDLTHILTILRNKHTQNRFWCDCFYTKKIYYKKNNETPIYLSDYIINYKLLSSTQKEIINHLITKTNSNPYNKKLNREEIRTLYFYNYLTTLLNYFIFSNFEKITLVDKSGKQINFSSKYPYLLFSDSGLKIALMNKEGSDLRTSAEVLNGFDISECITKIADSVSFSITNEKKKELILNSDMTALEISKGHTKMFRL